MMLGFTPRIILPSVFADHGVIVILAAWVILGAYPLAAEIVIVLRKNSRCCRNIGSCLRRAVSLL